VTNIEETPCASGGGGNNEGLLLTKKGGSWRERLSLSAKVTTIRIKMGHNHHQGGRSKPVQKAVRLKREGCDVRTFKFGVHAKRACGEGLKQKNATGTKKNIWGTWKNR